MEIFDIVDELGNPTGELVERTVAHAEGICHRTAHIWVVRKENEKYQVLLQRRGYDKDSFPGQLDTSSAGHIQAGDEPRESAIRELGEELGIKEEAENLKFIGNFRAQYEVEFYGKPFRDNEVVFVYIYDRPVDIDSLVLQEEELAGVEWHDLEEALEAVETDHPDYCIPPKGIALVKQYVDSLLCPCCEAHYFEEKNAYEICPICGWEDDKLQRKDPTLEGGANEMSLNQAKVAYQQEVANDED